MRIALFQPDIPQNTGTILRLSACLAVGVDIIEPCGFVFDDKRMRRAGMDYLNDVDLVRHGSWNVFHETCRQSNRRVLLLTTKSEQSYMDFSFQATDVLLVGRESAGVPCDVHNAADARLTIPMAPAMRSINVAMSAALVLGEALRQTSGFPCS